MTKELKEYFTRNYPWMIAYIFLCFLLNSLKHTYRNYLTVNGDFFHLTIIAMIFILILILHDEKRDAIIRNLMNSYKPIWLIITTSVLFIVYGIVTQSSTISHSIDSSKTSQTVIEMILVVLAIIIAAASAFVFNTKKSEETIGKVEEATQKLEKQNALSVIMTELNLLHTQIVNKMDTNTLESNKEILENIKKIQNLCNENQLDRSSEVLVKFLNEISLKEAIIYGRLFENKMIDLSKGQDIKFYKNDPIKSSREAFLCFFHRALKQLMKLKDQERNHEVRCQAYQLLIWLYLKLPTADSQISNYDYKAKEYSFIDYTADYKTVQEIYDEARLNNCYSAELDYQYANYCLKMHDYFLAINYFNRCITEARNGGKNLKADYFLRLGNAYNRIYELGKAEEAYYQANKLHPNNCTIYRKLGLLVAKNEAKGEFSSKVESPLRYKFESKAMFDLALSFDPRDTNAQVRQGEALYKKGEYKEAKAAFRFVNMLAPECSTAFLYRGLSDYYIYTEGSEQKEGGQATTGLTLSDWKKIVEDYSEQNSGSLKRSTSTQEILNILGTQDYKSAKDLDHIFSEHYLTKFVLPNLVRADYFLTQKGYDKTANDLRMHAAAKFYIVVCVEELILPLLLPHERDNQKTKEKIDNSIISILKKGLNYAKQAIERDRTFSTAYHYYARISGKLFIYTKDNAYFYQSVSAFKCAFITNSCNKTPYYAKAMMHIQVLGNLEKLTEKSCSSTTCRKCPDKRDFILPKLCKATQKGYEDDIDKFDRHIKEIQFCVLVLKSLSKTGDKPHYLCYLKKALEDIVDSTKVNKGLIEAQIRLLKEETGDSNVTYKLIKEDFPENLDDQISQLLNLQKESGLTLGKEDKETLKKFLKSLQKKWEKTTLLTPLKGEIEKVSNPSMNILRDNINQFESLIIEGNIFTFKQHFHKVIDKIKDIFKEEVLNELEKAQAKDLYEQENLKALIKLLTKSINNL